MNIIESINDERYKILRSKFLKFNIELFLMYLFLNIFYSLTSLLIILRLTNCLYSYNIDLADYSSIYTTLFSFTFSLMYIYYVSEDNFEYPLIEPKSFIIVNRMFTLTIFSFIIILVSYLSHIFIPVVHCCDGSNDPGPSTKTFIQKNINVQRQEIKAL